MTDKVTFEVSGLAARLREAVANSDTPDSGAIAETLYGELAGDELDTAVQRGLKLLVERTARGMKTEAIRRAREEAATAQRPAREARERSAARQRLTTLQRDHQQALEDKFFAIWKETPTGRKFLGECSAQDLRYSSQRNQERGDACHRAASEDWALAEALDESTSPTVRDLGYDLAIRAMGERA